MLLSLIVALSTLAAAPLDGCGATDGNGFACPDSMLIHSHQVAQSEPRAAVDAEVSHRPNAQDVRPLEVVAGAAAAGLNYDSPKGPRRQVVYAQKQAAATEVVSCHGPRRGTDSAAFDALCLRRAAAITSGHAPAVAPHQVGGHPLNLPANCVVLTFNQLDGNLSVSCRDGASLSYVPLEAGEEKSATERGVKMLSTVAQQAGMSVQAREGKCNVLGQSTPCQWVETPGRLYGKNLHGLVATIERNGQYFRVVCDFGGGAALPSICEGVISAAEK